MIIQITSNQIDYGYLNRAEHSVVSPFFAGANVAFRRQSLVEIGLYDEKCRSGEDQDICLRVARSGWELYFEPGARVKHRNQMSLKTHIRKWFDYGFYHPYVFQKHTTKTFTVFIPGRGAGTQSLYKRIISFRSPVRAIVFLNPFLAMLFFTMLCLALLAFGLPYWALASAAISLVFGAAYFWPDIRKHNIWKGVVFIWLRSLANSALLAGGFLGGARTGMIYISGTL